MANKTSTELVAALLICFAAAGGIMAAGGGGDSIGVKCAAQLQKVAPCLSFATEKAASPSKECCDSTSQLKDSEPACLCYIIQQVHNGSAAVKSMGLQESRLLQLPSACKLANASVAECPKLLNLAPNSTDASIFNNVSSSTTTTPVATPASTTAANKGEWHKPQLAGYLTVAMVVVFHALGLMPC